MRARAALRIGVLALPLLFGERLAWASPAFPDVVREELALGSAPVCTICHDNPSGGFGTATTAFATYLRSRGLRAGDTESLRTALAAARGERHDSDGDGVTDVDQLRDGRDPSARSDDAAPPPEFGCSARVAPRSTRAPGGELALVALALGWARLRRHSGAKGRRRFDGGL